jgi:hypothetical protein
MSYFRCVLTTSVVLAVACGGSSATDTITGDGGGTLGDATSPSSSGDGSPSTSGSSGSSGGSSSDDSGLMEVDDSGYVIIPGGDDGGGDDGGSATGSSGGGSMDGAVGVTTPPHGTDGGANQIECGATPCDSTTQFCCASALGRTCTAIGGTCQGDTLACSGTNSCASGEVCCEEIPEAGRTIKTVCHSACGLAPQLCTVDSDCANKPADICRKFGDYGVCERPAAATHDI